MGKFLACLLAVSLAPALAAQTTIHVPTDQPTIQAGIDAATNGDLVLVSPGTYYENIDFLGKLIRVTSSAGAAATVIDGSSRGAVVTFRNGETSEAELSGFTIQHGGATSPESTAPEGGIFIEGGDPDISNNVITQNACNGITVIAAAPLIEGNTISSTIDAGPALCTDNDVASAAGPILYGGVGLFLRTTAPRTFFAISNPVFHTGLQISKNTIENNIQGTAAGGMLALASDWEAENNIIRNNVADNGAGATIFAFDGAPYDLLQNLIYGNAPSGRGVYKAAVDIDSAGVPTAAIEQASGIVSTNTIAGNAAVAGSLAAQLYIGPSGASHIVFSNNMVAGGSASVPAMRCGPDPGAASPFDGMAAAYNDVYNSSGPASAGVCSPVAGAYGNISADPQFAGPDDFHVGLTSAAANAALDVLEDRVLQGNDYSGSPDSSTLQPPGVYGFPETMDLLNSPRFVLLPGNQQAQDIGALQNPPAQLVFDDAFSLCYNYADLYQVTPGSAVLNAVFVNHNFQAAYGNMQFLLDFAPLGEAPLVAGAGGENESVTVLTPSALPLGVHTILSRYPGDTGGHTPCVTAPYLISVAQNSTSLSLAASGPTIIAGQPEALTAVVATSDGAGLSPVTFEDAYGASTLGVVATDSTGRAVLSTTALDVGEHHLAASVAGDSSHNSARAFTTVTVTPNTATTLSVSPNPARPGDLVVLTATVAPLGTTALPTGTVEFFDSGQSLGGFNVSATANSAAAIYTSSTFALGEHRLLAIYTPAPGSPFAPSQSAPVDLLVADPDFTLEAPPAITIETEHHGSLTVTLTSTGGFTGPVQLSCAPALPEYLTCEFGGDRGPSSEQVQLTPGSTASIPLVLDTDAILDFKSSINPPPLPGSQRRSVIFAGLLPLALLLLGRRRSATSRATRRLLTLCCVWMALAALSGCSSKYPGHVAPGTYLISLQAAGAPNGSTTPIAHNLTVTLTVTP